MSLNIPEEAVEAAARADWTSYTEARGKDAFGDYPTFDSLPAYIQDKYRDDVRPMLVAAAPLLTAPRTVTTAEELDALPADSVVLDGQGLALVSGGDGQWHVGINGDIWHAPAVMYHGPATVLHTPEETQ